MCADTPTTRDNDDAAAAAAAAAEQRLLDKQKGRAEAGTAAVGDREAKESSTPVKSQKQAREVK
jgi:hypothetical protein